jgi:hypothetical protein
MYPRVHGTGHLKSIKIVQTFIQIVLNPLAENEHRDTILMEAARVGRRSTPTFNFNKYTRASSTINCAGNGIAVFYIIT